jgi:VanZ family protein
VELIHGLIRKAGHATEYFVLGILLFRAFRGGSTEEKVWRWALLAAVVTVFYAASDEFHQSFVSTRTPSFWDVGIDSAAGFFSQVAGVVWYRRRQR